MIYLIREIININQLWWTKLHLKDTFPCVCIWGVCNHAQLSHGLWIWTYVPGIGISIPFEVIASAHTKRSTYFTFGSPSVCCQTSLYLRFAFKSLLQRVMCLSVLFSVCLVFMPFQRQRLDSSSSLIARTLLQPQSLWNILANIVHLYNSFLA